MGSGKQRPLDSGRKDALGRAVKVAADAGESRADAPAPQAESEPVSSSAARRGVMKADAMLGHPDLDGYDPEDIGLLAQDAITNLMHWAEAHGADTDSLLGGADRHFESERGEGDDLANDPWHEEQIAQMQSGRERAAGEVSVSRDDLAAILRDLDNMTSDAFSKGGDRQIRDRLTAMLGIDKTDYDRGDYSYGLPDDAVYQDVQTHAGELYRIGWKAVGFNGWNDGNPILTFDTSSGRVMTRRQDYGDYSATEFARFPENPAESAVWTENHREFGLTDEDRENVFDDAVWNLEASVARAVEGDAATDAARTARAAEVQRWFQ